MRKFVGALLLTACLSPTMYFSGGSVYRGLQVMGDIYNEVTAKTVSESEQASQSFHIHRYQCIKDLSLSLVFMLPVMAPMLRKEKAENLEQKTAGFS